MFPTQINELFDAKLANVTLNGDEISAFLFYIRNPLDLILKLITKFQDESGCESFVLKFGIDGPDTNTFTLINCSFFINNIL